MIGRVWSLGPRPGLVASEYGWMEGIEGCILPGHSWSFSVLLLVS